ncbi:hypothetical protein BV898_13171 [Hypsibius exemplaris]|uniref:G-protein coupled receptors family 1 profile domain-containing protein n=1 Tax=Hypsibius exemplaris TaxID=2072580 RepID=A0A1W0WBH9_HYPEX|nr:hypothetical protein BV898_13171 [Hypsibius exemplaris]
MGPKNSIQPIPAVEAGNSDRLRGTSLVKTSKNRLTGYLLLLKLVAHLFDIVPTALIIVAVSNRRLPPPCIWDAIHSAEHFFALVQLVEPFVYLATMRDLRIEFLSLLRLT